MKDNMTNKEARNNKNNGEASSREMINGETNNNSSSREMNNGEANNNNNNIKINDNNKETKINSSMNNGEINSNNRHHYMMIPRVLEVLIVSSRISETLDSSNKIKITTIIETNSNRISHKVSNGGKKLLQEMIRILSKGMGNNQTLDNKTIIRISDLGSSNNKIITSKISLIEIIHILESNNHLSNKIIKVTHSRLLIHLPIKDDCMTNHLNPLSEVETQLQRIKIRLQQVVDISSEVIVPPLHKILQALELKKMPKLKRAILLLSNMANRISITINSQSPANQKL